jgi:hypothetical protein
VVTAIDKPARSVNRVAAFALAAVLSGIYLGASTVAAIDPFYLNDQSATGSSYTSNGWRGADAVSPPVIPVADRMSEFVANAYGAATRDALDSPVHVGEAVAEPIDEDHIANVPGADLAGGYECVNCEGGDIAIAAPREPVSDCPDGDPACVSAADRSEQDGVGDAGSVQPLS